jgi:hypothetical protein
MLYITFIEWLPNAKQTIWLLNRGENKIIIDVMMMGVDTVLPDETENVHE